MKTELRHLSFLDSEHDKGNICPACPKVIKCMHAATIWLCSSSLLTILIW